MTAYPPHRLSRILPRQNHCVPEPERNVGGGQGLSSGERIRPTRGAARAWQSIKGTQTLSLASQSFFELQVLGDYIFFPKLGRKRRPTAGRKTSWDRK